MMNLAMETLLVSTGINFPLARIGEWETLFGITGTKLCELN